MRIRQCWPWGWGTLHQSCCCVDSDFSPMVRGTGSPWWGQANAPGRALFRSWASSRGGWPAEPFPWGFCQACPIQTSSCCVCSQMGPVLPGLALTRGMIPAVCGEPHSSWGFWHLSKEMWVTEPTVPDLLSPALGGVQGKMLLNSWAACSHSQAHGPQAGASAFSLMKSS